MGGGERKRLCVWMVGREEMVEGEGVGGMLDFSVLSTLARCSRIYCLTVEFLSRCCTIGVSIKDNM